MTGLREWLEREPLQLDEQLFAVLGSTSDCGAIAAWRQAGGGAPSPIWAGSEYAGWQEVMPYVAVVAVDSAFLDWVDECEACDWGWLAVSTCPLQTVVEHLRGLTKVLLPEGQAVFFRFWDGAYLLPVLQALGARAGEVIPVFRRYWINGQSHEVAGAVVGVARNSPWWKVPAPVLKCLEERSTVTLVDNLLQWLEEQRSDLHAAFALTTLRHKVAYFARGPNEGHQALAAYLTSELGKPSDHGPAPLPV
ncbi:DUF4123 domain-containing protein [Pseudomonas fluorescens]|uniref:DUF4123 domain-containing protein n=1 Tax=Pseudomonas fluorescens TaxID=294 RepID=UPI001BE990C8|nr:DUF4123 domain-containing protein [Pseudomonas fluorescens]MBT2370644.1 DUF4123 domain-containing protein [Pseudomonas fluorescens]